MALPEPIADHLLPTLERLVAILNARQVAYALIGGLGVAFHGPVRATRDIDLLVAVPQMDLPAVLDALVEGGFALDVAAAIESWNRDNLLDFSSGSVRVDWLKP